MAQLTRDVTVKTIDGRECTDRAGIAVLAGIKPGNSINVRAATDPDFPHSVRPERIGKTFWYPFDGEHGVTAYLAVLAQRAEAKKPPPVEEGDDGDLLDAAQAAQALHITDGTFRRYVHDSKPFWPAPFGEGRKGRPILACPDWQEEVVDELTGEPVTRREWRRGTLRTHQAGRPGPGNTDGFKSTKPPGRPRRTSDQ